MQKIKLTKEAARAVKRKGPSDEWLLNMLNRSDESDMPAQVTLRWMAHFILVNSGYQFEE